MLIELLAQSGCALPKECADIDRLTPFGTVFRYEEVLPQALQDRTQWLSGIRRLRGFVESLPRG